MHHDEWGLSSNTGKLVELTMEPARVLMKGLPEHDDELAALVEDESVETCVLWPSAAERAGGSSEGGGEDRDGEAGGAGRDHVTLEAVQAMLASGRRVVIIAVDASWRNARRMVRKLPPSRVRRLSLKAEALYGDGGPRPSLLAPLRAYNGAMRTELGGSERSCVCTLEAVVAAVRALGHDPGGCEHALAVARKKVAVVSRYRGKVGRPKESI